MRFIIVRRILKTHTVIVYYEQVEIVIDNEVIVRSESMLKLECGLLWTAYLQYSSTCMIKGLVSICC